MEGGGALQGKAPQRLLGINTLANTMKHCINVSNYRLGGRVGGGGGVSGWADAIRMSHWLSITTTVVEKTLSVKTALMRWSLSESLQEEMLGQKEEDFEETREEAPSVYFKGCYCPISLSNQLFHRPLSSSSALFSTALPKPQESRGIWRQSDIMVFANNARVFALIYLE